MSIVHTRGKRDSLSYLLGVRNARHGRLLRQQELVFLRQRRKGERDNFMLKKVEMHSIRSWILA